MKLPIKPEPLHEMRARYLDAVNYVVDAEGIQLGTVSRPGEQRRHVFDCQDGIRLIISQDTPGVIHLSASTSDKGETFKEGCRIIQSHPVPDMIGGAIIASALLTTRALANFRLISGDQRQPQFHCLSKGGILHWKIEG